MKPPYRTARKDPRVIVRKNTVISAAVTPSAAGAIVAELNRLHAEAEACRRHLREALAPNQQKEHP